MSWGARIVVAAALVACRHSTTERERALARLPGAARLVAAADGAALATPAFRRVLDAARSHVPASLGCVIDAALAADTVAVAETALGTTIVIVSYGSVASCAALSKLDATTWVATIGAGSLATDVSVASDPRWARARPYLASAPAALALDLGDRRVMAAAQPDPLDAWLAIDAADPAGLEREARAFIERWRALPTSGLVVRKLVVDRRGDQLVVRGQDLGADDLLAIANHLLEVADAPPPVAPVALACPPAGLGVASCSGTHVVVPSLRDALDRMLGGPLEPVVSAGDVIGLRLVKQPILLLAAGDLVLGVDGHSLTDPAQVTALIGAARHHVTLAVRRGTTDLVIDLDEP